MAVTAAHDFYLFFVDVTQATVVRLEQLPRQLDAEWTRAAAYERRLADVRDLTPQDRGTQFERLWRDLLSFHGWHPKKIRIRDEDNGFTALYNGLHILGETRWFATPMKGGKMREFLAKLDTRPQTVGLFVLHSGYDDGALSLRLRRPSPDASARPPRTVIPCNVVPEQHRSCCGDATKETPQCRDRVRPDRRPRVCRRRRTWRPRNA
ncbi:hypothetical protein ACQPZP_20450 [Spirillospora sp. CA-142024]|uniref:hypothetical protein n=1 Tax=Spirillospora sp. CA-142024 TaxID=3240036 RepID=UPI003D89F0AA